MTPRRRSRSESMIKLEQQKKEAKVWFEEANVHVKLGNLLKAQHCYQKVSKCFFFAFFFRCIFYIF